VEESARFLVRVRVRGRLDGVWLLVSGFWCDDAAFVA
jgi:hypothetical protein